MDTSKKRLNAGELRKGTTDEMVSAPTIKNYRNETVTKKCMDTDEVLMERPMTGHERQLGLKIVTPS